MAKNKQNVAELVIPSDSDLKLVWNGKEVVWSDVPEASRFALAQSGFTHKLGNEVASQITVAKAKRIKGSDGKDTTEPKYTADELEDMANTKREAMVDAILDGTLATRVGAPKLKGFEAVLRDTAERMLRTAYAQKRTALPKGDAWKAKIADAMANSAKVREEAQRIFDASQEEAELDIEL